MAIIGPLERETSNAPETRAETAGKGKIRFQSIAKIWGLTALFIYAKTDRKVDAFLPHTNSGKTTPGLNRDEGLLFEGDEALYFDVDVGDEPFSNGLVVGEVKDVELAQLVPAYVSYDDQVEMLQAKLTLKLARLS